MPTTNTRYVDPNAAAGGNGTTNALSGGNCAYVSLSAWEAARQANLVTGDIIERVVCSSDDAGSTHAADTTPLNIAGWTTDATRYIQIDAASSHGGKWNSGIYRMEFSNSATASTQFYVAAGHVRVNGIQISETMTGTWACNVVSVQSGATDVRLDRCIVRQVGAGGASSRAYLVQSGALRLTNCLAYDWSHTGDVAFRGTTGGSMDAYNCTAQNCTTACSQGAACTFTAKNFGAASCTTGFSGTITQTTCSTTGPTFVDEANDDFHLAAADTTWKNQGTDLSATFTDDIDGQTRPTGAGTWDIGADEYVAAGPPLPLLNLLYMGA